MYNRDYRFRCDWMGGNHAYPKSPKTHIYGRFHLWNSIHRKACYVRLGDFWNSCIWNSICVCMFKFVDIHLTFMENFANLPAKFFKHLQTIPILMKSIHIKTRQPQACLPYAFYLWRGYIKHCLVFLNFLVCLFAKTFSKYF